MSDKPNTIMNATKVDCQEAASYLGVSVKTVRRWAQSGKLSGIKVGSRGDWRFSHDEMDRLIRYSHDDDIYRPIADYLKNKSFIISKDASIRHQRELSISDVRIKKIISCQYLSIELIHILADHLNSVSQGKKAFENLSVRIAEEALNNGLTVEEIVDEVMYLKQAIISSLEKTNLLFKLQSHNLYKLMRTISLYNDIVVSQIAFSYHNQHKRYLEALRQSEEKFFKVFDLSPVAYTIRKLSNNETTNANEKFLKLIGLKLSEIIGKNLIELGVYPNHKTQDAYSIGRELLLKTGFISKVDVEMIANNSQTKSIQCSSVLIKIHGEDHVLTSYIDIDEKKRAYKQKVDLEHLAATHTEMVKLAAAKDQFIGIASHQLRTPATAVKQYIGMILSDMVGDITPKQRKYLETAYNSNERQLKLINDFLKTAQIDASTYKLNRKSLVVSELVQTAIDSLKPTFKKRQQIIVMTDESDAKKACVDATEIDLVFSNLLDNASKYSPAGSTIGVSLRPNSKYLEISFTDQGEGIDSEDQMKIFDKFTRVKNSLTTPDNGHGLGLYWVKQIIEMHDGKIMVDSKLGQGATFRVWLPL